MAKISIFTPCYNEEANVVALYEAVKAEMEQLPQYEYEHIFSENASTDSTAELLREIAAKDSRVKVILNNRNFGPGRSGAFGFYHCTGDANICLACDFQDPPEYLRAFIHLWEDGYKVVWGRKTGSREGVVMKLCRGLFYKVIKRFSDVPQYEQVTGFGLYDKEVLDLMRSLNDPFPSFRHLVADFGYEVGFVDFVQPERRAGKSSYSFFSYLQMAIKMMITTSTAPLKIATFLGFCMAGLSFLVGLVYLIMKLAFWYNFDMGMAPVVIGLFFLGSVQLLFIGILGEYIGEILNRVTRRPLVVAKEKLNMDEEQESMDENLITNR